MLTVHNRKLHGELFTGPIDGPRENTVPLHCPTCDWPELIFTPAQFGQCHGGFATRVLRSHYFCQECNEVFVEEEA